MATGRERHQRVKDLFLEACERDGDAREEFLVGLAAEDPSLRADVEVLLAADSRPSDLMDETGPFRAAIEELEVPRLDRIGPYDVLGVLGEGGMGVVYRAERDLPRRKVALKVIRPGLMSRKMLERFAHEVQVLGRLQHPGIAQVFEAGIADTEIGRLPYFALELVDGPPLLEFAKEHELDVKQRLELFARVCDAVHHAHMRGVIHRDLKPANILVDPTGQPKVLDFGIARATASDEYTLTQPTALSQLVGTIPYMSPEQAAGEFEDLDARSDVYALGVILYELLAGDLPYPVRNTPLLDSVRVIQVKEPRPLHRVNPRFKGDLDAIASMALAKERERRFQSVSELAADIHRHLLNEPVQAHSPTTIYHVAKFAKRNPAIAGGLAMAVASLMVGFLVALAFYFDEVEARQEAQARAQVMEFVADALSIEDLNSRERYLWPRRRYMLTEFDAWIGEARRLVNRLEGHRQTLRLLAEGSLSFSEDEGPPDSQEKTLTLLLDRETQNVLALENLNQESGLLSKVDRRRRLAGEIWPRTIEDRLVEWDEAINSILLSDQYGDLQIEPQEGLIPLREDPETDLWEFWLWESGERPEPSPKTGQWTVTKETGIIFVLIPGGSFLMGSEDSPREGPVREVTLEPFFLAKYEMTQAQYLRIMGENPSYYHPGLERFNPITLVHPVDRVHWAECREAMRRLDLCLPTEAQWEYAARARTASAWWTGTGPGSIEGRENLSDQSVRLSGFSDWPVEDWNDGYATTAPVGSFEPNPFGLHDMLGNVSEWCRDWYLEHYRLDVDPVDGRRLISKQDAEETGAGRVVRGGSLAATSLEARCSYRFPQLLDSRVHSIGVRPARRIDWGDERDAAEGGTNREASGLETVHAKEAGADDR